MPRLMWRLGRRPRCAIAIRIGHRADIVVIGTVIIIAVRLAIFGPSLETGERAPFEGNQHRSLTPVEAVCLSKLCEREPFARPVPPMVMPRREALPACPPAGARSLRA